MTLYVYYVVVSDSCVADSCVGEYFENVENKVSKKFARTFCNTSGFGISDEGALKFALGETKGEFLNKPMIEEIDLKDLKDQILVDIADTCNYFDVARSDLQDLILEYKN